MFAMQLRSVLVLLLACTCQANVEKTSAPINKVIKLISGLKASIEEEGKVQQEDFDKYACWCEEKLATTAKQISDAAALLDKTQQQITENMGKEASMEAEVKNLEKELAKNVAEHKEATSARDSEHSAYASERLEYENTIGALEAAIKVFSSKKGFLDTSTHQVQLLSVAGQIRKTLTQQKAIWDALEEPENIQLLRSFVSDPEAFVTQRKSSLSVVQFGRNPFGDYAPQSTQIQGLLKGMYDGMTANLEKANAEEAESQKSYEELDATKSAEKKTLSASLVKQKTDHASTVKKLAELKVLRDNTEEQKNADEEFFADTKAVCKKRAKEWALRSRLRTEELNGMATAINILSSKSAQSTFKSSHETFLQLSSVQHHQGRSALSLEAYHRLMKMAADLHSVKMVKIAAALKSRGHFDGIITSIDDMMSELRKEEQNDIHQRDMCENKQNENKEELEDLNAAIKKTKLALGRMANAKSDLEEEIEDLKKQIKASKSDLKDLLEFREKEEAAFKKSQKDDNDAKSLILQARDALLKFYEDNKQSLPSFLQEPLSQQDAGKPGWQGTKYGGRKSESAGIVSILEMMAEDIAKEIAETKADDAEAEEQFKKQKAALDKAIEAQTNTKVSTEEELADLDEKIDQYGRYKKEKSDDKDAELETKNAIDASCEWVKTNFKSRKEKRKDEMDGLVEAKNYLAGVEAGEDPLPVN